MHFCSKVNIESLYNEGKGIQITATFIGLLPRPKAGEKRRSNAKPPTTTKVIYIHEKMPFVNAVYIIVGQSLGRQDLCDAGGLDEDNRLTRVTPFRLEYTIPRSTFKDVELHSAADWKTFMEEAAKKAVAHGKLVVKEQMVAFSFGFFLVPAYAKKLSFRLLQLREKLRRLQTTMTPAPKKRMQERKKNRRFLPAIS